jgi:polar amino acid transport system permease protein
MSWNWSIAADVFPVIFKAMWTTLGLTLCCYAFAVIFGMIWTLLKRIKFKPIVWLVNLIIEFIRTTPPLVQLFFLYFAWPLVPYVGMTLSPWTVSILGLGIHYSTYVSETYRSGIESVSKGQWEAATALNFSTRQKWSKIILPQAIPPIVPMLGNYMIIMFKEIPLTIVAGVTGMLTAAKAFGDQNFSYLEPLTLVACFFLVLSYPSSLLVRYLEKKMNRRFDKKSQTGARDMKSEKEVIA